MNKDQDNEATSPRSVEQQQACSAFGDCICGHLQTTLCGSHYEWCANCGAIRRLGGSGQALMGWVLPALAEASQETRLVLPKLNIGEIIIAAVIRADALEAAERPTPDSTIFVWAANAEEQIEAALHDAGYTLLPNAKLSNPHPERTPQ